MSRAEPCPCAQCPATTLRDRAQGQACAQSLWSFNMLFNEIHWLEYETLVRLVFGDKMMKTLTIITMLAVVNAATALAETDGTPSLAHADVVLDKSTQQKVRSIAIQAYAEASDFSLTSMDGTIIKGGFVLANDEEGLGKKENRIAEVQIRIFAGEQTRGLVLVNVDTEKPLVVFPKRRR